METFSFVSQRVSRAGRARQPPRAAHVRDSSDVRRVPTAPPHRRAVPLQSRPYPRGTGCTVAARRAIQWRVERNSLGAALMRHIRTPGPSREGRH
ncbi:unnamed protein product [Colias eurytheme]|nr:unnamed protein product [Colias eurytheme]